MALDSFFHNNSSRIDGPTTVFLAKRFRLETHDGLQVGEGSPNATDGSAFDLESAGVSPTRSSSPVEPPQRKVGPAGTSPASRRSTSTVR